MCVCVCVCVCVCSLLIKEFFRKHCWKKRKRKNSPLEPELNFHLETARILSSGKELDFYHLEQSLFVYFM